jgi:dienelactone hydrolase
VGKDKKDIADFCVLDSAPENRLSSFERSTLFGGDELERALNWASRQLASVRFDELLPIASHEEFFAHTALFTQANDWNSEWIAKPAAFFAPPQQVPVVRSTFFHGFPDGQVLDLSYSSSYSARHRLTQTLLDENTENQTVHARYWRHNVRGGPALVAVHGWTMGDQRINSLAFLPGLFYQLGFDVVLIELPFHGRRKAKKGPFEKASFFPSLNVLATNEVMAQAISDLRQLALYIRQDGVNQVGCMGMSLGAYVGVLWASLDKLDFCVPIVPMVSMAELAWEVVTRHERFKPLREAGLSLDLLESVYRIHSPLQFQPATDKKNMLIVAGIGDKIVPARQPKLLWDHWKRPRIVWFQGGHVPQFKKSRTFNEVAAFFVDLGLVSAERVQAVLTAPPCK